MTNRKRPLGYSVLAVFMVLALIEAASEFVGLPPVDGLHDAVSRFLWGHLLVVSAALVLAMWRDVPWVRGLAVWWGAAIVARALPSILAEGFPPAYLWTDYIAGGAVLGLVIHYIIRRAPPRLPAGAVPILPLRRVPRP